MNATYLKTNRPVQVLKRHEDYAVPMNECRFEDGHTGMLKDDEIRIDNESFARGLKTGMKHEVITIAVNNVWGGRTKDGGSTSSYEKIGYHAGSVDFLDGVLASGCPVERYTDVDGNLVKTEVTESPWSNPNFHEIAARYHSRNKTS